MITAQEAKALLILAEENSARNILYNIESRIKTAIKQNRSILGYKSDVLIPSSVLTELKNLGYKVDMNCFRTEITVEW